MASYRLHSPANPWGLVHREPRFGDLDSFWPPRGSRGPGHCRCWHLQLAPGLTGGLCTLLLLAGGTAGRSVLGGMAVVGEGMPCLSQSHLDIPKVSFCFCFSLLHRLACRVLVPQPAIKSEPLAVEACHPNHWTTRKVPKMPIPNCLLDIFIWISKNLKPMKYKATFLLLPIFPFSPP